MFRKALTLSVIYVFLSLPFLVFASASVPSSELICHTSNQADCYPRVFEPSEDFRLVHDDQEIPAGLHVRLNLETGLKEAKLYDASEDSSSQQAVHMSGGGAVQIVPGEEVIDTPVIADSPPALPSAPEHPSQEPWRPLQNLYQKVLKSPSGPVKPPLNSDGDGTAFNAALEALQDASARPASATISHLDLLEDLTHDIYWGRTLAEHPAAVQTLSRLLHSKHAELAGKAALVLGNSVRNNKGALQAVTSYTFASDVGSASPTDGSVYGSVLARLGLDPPRTHGLAPPEYARLVFLLSSLLQEPRLRGAFAAQNHPLALLSEQHFGAVAAAHTPEWNRPRAKLADLVADHFADPATFPSVAVCVDPACPGRHLGDAEVECAGKPAVAPSELDLLEFEACRAAADAETLDVLRRWENDLHLTAHTWHEQGPDGPGVAVVEHIEQALNAVTAATGAAVLSSDTADKHLG